MTKVTKNGGTKVTKIGRTRVAREEKIAVEKVDYAKSDDRREDYCRESGLCQEAIVSKQRTYSRHSC